MVDEGYVISQVQVMEGVLNSNNVTVHSDGTSRDHKKIVGHQLSLSNGETFYLGYVPVACENANTLLDLSLSVLQQLYVTYSDFSFIDTHELMKTVLSKITSLMTDRAAAMKSYGRLFEEHVKSEIGGDVIVHFLHCSAHYLLGLVSACEKAVSAIECNFVREHGSLGRDKEKKFVHFADAKEIATFCLLRTACEVLGPNGDQKSGCRMDWVSFCEKSQIPSFKGNRFNCHFEAAAAIIFHVDKIKTFFTSGILNAPNLKLESVSCDVQDNTLMSIACCLALFFLKVTGPFWKLVNSSVKFTDFHHYFKMLDGALSRWSADPNELLNHDFICIFDDQMCAKSVMFDAVHDFASKCDSGFLTAICKSLCQEALIVTRRQLVDFLDDGYFTNMSSHAQEQLRHCSLTNLIGESSFGDFDFDISKRRNATLHNRSAVHRFKRIKTSKFLGRKSQSQTSRLLKIARKRAPLLRKENKEMDEKMKNAKKEKFIENQEQKIAKEINDVEKRSNLTEKVKKHGGPFSSHEELENFLKNNRKKSITFLTDNIKDEIRFQKFVVGHKNLKLGSLEEMVNYLKAVLQEERPFKRHCYDFEEI
ncbi:hypothetical protein ElyMa_000440800 [Elysia marginata]|uniref:Uncharacterized protein n=1 Tax=Elysia marginata TaxID=1093978 RepID=A0AAV4FNS3_9GAST|nr:hypothetical protein ElyMa_000440800 [Elysia marginata]